MVNWLKCFWFLQQMIDLTIRRFDTMRTIFAEYNPKRNSIDVYTSVGYMLRIDCWEAEKNLKTTPCSDWALNALAIDEPLEYARLYLDGTVQMWVDAEDSFYLWWLNCHSQYLREWQFLYLFEYNLVFELLYGKIKRANTIIFSRNLDNALHLMVSMESWHRILGICKI